MRIYVTKNDIASGVPCNSGKCPLARSLQRRFPKKFVTVGRRGGMIGWTPVLWSETVRLFINDFDNTRSLVKPFSFTLDL